MGGRQARTNAQAHHGRRRLRLLGLSAVLVAVVALAAWLAAGWSEGGLPSYARHPRVAEAYRYARHERALLAQIPCTCGCEAVGHRSNADCYIKAVRGRRVVWDPHAAG